jgi:protein disulfide-isomerase A1
MPAVVLFRKFDESPVVFADKIESAALNVFAQTESVPTLIDFSEDYIEPIFGNKKAALFLFRSADAKDSEYMKTFAAASKSMKGDILFVESGVSEGIQERLAEFIGVTKDDLPTMRILDPAANMKKFTWEGKMDDLNADAISKFVGDFKAGSLQAFLKSEEVPAEQGDVTVLVGKNFKELVIDSDDDVLVKFYAPWCGHCKKLTPVWDELGKDLKDVKGLKIAKMDSTANEVDGVEIKGYPTLKFYAKGAKDAPVDYDGERGAEDFKKWLKEKSVHYKSHEESKADL